MSRRIQFVQKSVPLVVATNTTIASTTVALNGILRGVKSKSPAAVDSSATLKVDITDPDGDNVYTKSTIAVATTNQDYFDVKNNPNAIGSTRCRNLHHHHNLFGCTGNEQN